VPEKKVVSNNGMFRPLIVFDGQIIGAWKRRFEKGEMRVEAGSFKRFRGPVKAAVETAAEKIGGFYGMKTEVFLYPSEGRKNHGRTRTIFL
jgi:hypothetical protein